MKKWLKYLIVIVVFLLVAVIGFAFEVGIQNNKGIEPFTWAEFGANFAGNALQASGALCVASGLLYYTTSEGFFDGFVYATKQVWSTLTKKTKYPYTFAEYKLIKHPEDEQKVFIWHFIIVGLALIGIGFGVFYIK